MGSVKICEKSRKIPYFAKCGSVNLYSLEELSYYLYENIYMIDQSLMEERLYQWIQEAGYENLAEKLRQNDRNGSHFYQQVLEILQFSEYYTQEQLSDLQDKIKELSGMQEQERMKYRADWLAKNENLWPAIGEYERILRIRQNSRLSVDFYGAVWNNLGACYGRMFLFEKAACCYEAAYRFSKLPEYKKYGACARKLWKWEDSQKNRLSEEEKKLEELIEKELERIREKAKETIREADQAQLRKSWIEKYKKCSIK